MLETQVAKSCIPGQWKAAGHLTKTSNPSEPSGAITHSHASIESSTI